MNSILIHLLNHRTQQFTINQLSKDLNINYRIAHQQVESLQKEGLITTQKAGQARLCSLTGTFNEKIFAAEFQRRQAILKNRTFKTIHNRFAQAKQSYILLLFGSQAKGTQHPQSDIDLLAITEDEKEIQDITDLIPKDIHLTTVSYQTFIDMANSKELTVGSQAIKHNIILIGIEEYYRLLANAQ